MKRPSSTDATGVLTVIRRTVCNLAVIAGLAGTVFAQEHVIVNFDDPTLGPGVHAGNIFLGDGVRITTCNAPDVLATGNVITLANLQSWFEIWQYGWAVSPPNYIVALNAGTNDMLLSFTVPVTSVAMNLDYYPYEAPDLDRLVVLQSAGGNNFTVLKLVEFTDENAVPPPTHVSIDLGGTPFSYVLFQTLVELEGFDDLEFFTTGPIPPPSGEGPPGPPPPGSGGWEGGGGGSGGGTEPPPPTTPPDNENSSGPNPPANENKAPDVPSTGDQSGAGGTGSDGTGGTGGGDGTAGTGGTGGGGGFPTLATNTNSSGQTNTNASGGGSAAGGGACGAPVAIVMLCGALLVRLLAGQPGRKR